LGQSEREFSSITVRLKFAKSRQDVRKSGSDGN
jgi:hypothetical protein